jgi:hypothetical protein
MGLNIKYANSWVKLEIPRRKRAIERCVIIE